MKETIDKTIHDLRFAVDGLREALGKANNVEALIIMDLIGPVAEARRKAEALLDALTADNNEG